MLDLLAKTVRQEKEIKRIQIKKDILSLFLDNMILYFKNPNNFGENSSIWQSLSAK